MHTPPLEWFRRWLKCRLMGTSFTELKRAYDLAAAHGVEIEWNRLVVHKLAGGDIDSLVRGLIYARERGARISLGCACACEYLARLQYQLSLRDWLEPVIDSGATDIDQVGR